VGDSPQRGGYDGVDDNIGGYDKYNRDGYNDVGMHTMVYMQKGWVYE
jgi:hypothetical protein